MILILSGSTLGDVTNEPLKKLTYSIPTYVYLRLRYTYMYAPSPQSSKKQQKKSEILEVEVVGQKEIRSIDFSQTYVIINFQSHYSSILGAVLQVTFIHVHKLFDFSRDIKNPFHTPFFFLGGHTQTIKTFFRTFFCPPFNLCGQWLYQ